MYRSNLKYFAAVTAVLLTAGFLTGTPTFESTVASISAGNFSLQQEQALQDQTIPETRETSTVNLQEGLKAYYRFDNPEVSRGYSLEFDGSDDYLSIPESSHNSVASDFTVSGWLKVDEGSNSDSHTLVQKDSNYGLLFDGTPRIFLEVWDESSNRHKFYSGDISERINGWTHYVYTLEENNSVSLYLDGNLEDSWSIGFNVSDAGTNPVLIGKRNSDTYYTDGAIDEIRVYKRALSSSEVEALYEGLPVNNDSLVLQQSLDEGPNVCDLTSGNSCLIDDSYNDNDATSHNFDDNSFDTGSGWLNETPINRPTAKDYSENSRSGRFYSGVEGEVKFNGSNGWSTGKIGESSIHFDGEDDYVIMPSSFEPYQSDNDSWTLSTWFYITGNPSSEGTMTLIDNNHRYHLQLTSAGQMKSIPGGETLEWDWYPSLSEWHHATLVYDGDGKLKAYGNGELRASRTGVTPATDTVSGPFGLASHNPDTGPNNRRWYYGKMDDIRYYKKALSKSEVTSLYQGDSVTEKLAGRWNFEAGDLKTAYDTSNLANRGILGTSSINFSEGSKLETEVSLNDEAAVSGWVDPQSQKTYDLTSDGYVREQFVGMKWEGGNVDCTSDAPFNPGSIEPFHNARYGISEEKFWKTLNTSVNSTQGDYSDYMVDFDTVWGSDVSNGEAYMGAYVYSSDPRQVNFSVGSDDTRKMWINGELVHKQCQDQGLTVDDSTFSYNLRGGWNRIIMMVNEDSGGWGGQWRISSNNEGLRSTADPGVIYTTSNSVLSVKGDSLSAFHDGGSISFPFKQGWNYFSISSKGSQASFRINDLSGSFEEGGSPQTREMVLGRNFSGRLDELRVYNRSLSEEEKGRLAFR